MHIKLLDRRLVSCTGSRFKVSIWRHEMDQVVRCLDAYFATQTVFASWPTFLKRIGASSVFFDKQLPDSCPETLTTVTNLDEFCSAHEHSVDEVLQGYIMRIINVYLYILSSLAYSFFSACLSLDPVPTCTITSGLC